jgi:hypothetical protein
LRFRVAGACGVFVQRPQPCGSRGNTETARSEQSSDTYLFAVQPGGKPFRFKVELDQASAVTSVSVFRDGNSGPFQTLPACKDAITENLTEYDEKLELLEHADLNFDGFEDAQLLQFYNPHLGTKLYCIYVWDKGSRRFRYAPEIPAVNPVPHPEDKTITVHQDWQGGPYADSTYRWTGAKFELIEQHGRWYGSDDPRCGFTDHCEKLVSGKMITTLRRPATCSDNRPDPPLVCPTAATRPAQNAPTRNPCNSKKKLMPRTQDGTRGCSGAITERSVRRTRLSLLRSLPGAHQGAVQGARWLPVCG